MEDLNTSPCVSDSAQDVSQESTSDGVLLVLKSIILRPSHNISAMKPTTGLFFRDILTLSRRRLNCQPRTRPKFGMVMSN